MRNVRTMNRFVNGGGNTTWIGHTACFSAYLIFGFNIIICKDLMTSDKIGPLGVFTLRALVSSALFWMTGLFGKPEKIEKKDYPKIFVASMLGLFITQVSFLYGIENTTPVDWSIITVLSPIFTMFTAAIVLKEPITLKKAAGVAVSFIGIIVLILNGSHVSNSSGTSLAGVLLGLVNASSFALYLGIFRPLIQKYSVITFMKWMFLFSLVASLPFTAKELFLAHWSSISPSYYFKLSFLIIFATFIAYFLIPLGQKHIRPTIVSMYSYLQPIIASVVSIWIGFDKLTLLKVLAAATVVAGVVMVSRSKAGNATIANGKVSEDMN